MGFVKGGLTAEFDWEGMVQRIEDSLTFTFCGPPGTGVASSGVQQTLHQMCYNALNDIGDWIPCGSQRLICTTSHSISRSWVVQDMEMCMSQPRNLTASLKSSS